jgi:DNA/RNA-binding domain of Phe-tRNA-synthetase-like protein
MDQPKQTKADKTVPPSKEANETNRKIDNTTPSINPEVDFVNRTLP